MKDNKLIAEFMGAEPDKKTFLRTGKEVYFYHISWDWLMPVVQKCFEVAKHEDDFFAISGSLPYMDSTYDAVVEFIKQYNDEQQ